MKAERGVQCRREIINVFVGEWGRSCSVNLHFLLLVRLYHVLSTLYTVEIKEDVRNGTMKEAQEGSKIDAQNGPRMFRTARRSVTTALMMANRVMPQSRKGPRLPPKHAHI